MVSPELLIATANLYRDREAVDERYVIASGVLRNAIRVLGMDADAPVTPFRNSSRFIVLRTSGTTGEPKLLRHPMDFHESVIDAGVDALTRLGLRAPRTGLVAISRGRLSGGFLFVYEVLRRCGWSILMLGASDESDDIAELCAAHGVDTVFMAPNNIGAIFSPTMRGRFESVRNLLYIGEVPSPALTTRLRRDFPGVRLSPFIYSTNDTGPLGLPTADGAATTYDVPTNVLLEIEESSNGVTMNGRGQILVSVLGLEDPTLIRWRIGDVGELATDGEGRQSISLNGRGEVSVKFHLDTVGGSVILYRSVVVGFLESQGVDPAIEVILRIRNKQGCTAVEVNVITESMAGLDELEDLFNSTFPVAQLRGRFLVQQITDIDAKRISPGKRRFFVKEY